LLIFFTKSSITFHPQMIFGSGKAKEDYYKQKCEEIEKLQAKHDRDERTRRHQ